jgi:hypothetical protein
MFEHAALPNVVSIAILMLSILVLVIPVRAILVWMTAEVE